eukprot:11185576-Lingulodinium_polyedra.AAC.4
MTHPRRPQKCGATFAGRGKGYAAKKDNGHGAPSGANPLLVAARGAARDTGRAKRSRTARRDCARCARQERRALTLPNTNNQTPQP